MDVISSAALNQYMITNTEERLGCLCVSERERERERDRTKKPRQGIKL